LDVPGEKETPSDYHITILHFQKDLPIAIIAKALETAYDVISECEPFKVVSSKISSFPRREDNPIPIILPIESEELQELYKKLAKAFDKDKIEFSKTFKEYNPHITLAYSEEDHEDCKIDPAIEFVVNEVILFGGNDGDSRVFVTFPLKSPERTKHSSLIAKIELFNKLATQN
jgi:2'-5' RNA ligase